jgi:uncharacterized protein
VSFFGNLQRASALAKFSRGLRIVRVAKVTIMIHFEGDRIFPLPPADVFAKLSDASFLVGCLKDADEVTEKTADRAAWKLRPSFSFVRTTLEVVLDILDREPPGAFKAKVFSRGIGATSTVQAVLALKANGTGTAIHWSADIVELTGLLKLLPKGLILSSANKVIEDTWAEIGAKLV